MKMACEGCAIKFTLFKRKKQCTDCLRYYCTNCLIRLADRRLNCDKCSVLSRRPLTRSNLLEMRSKDLQHYLTAKKISTRGCVEKEDLVNLVIQHANSTDNNSSNHRTGSNFEDSPFMNAFRGFTSNIFNSSTSESSNSTRTGNVRHEVPPYARTTDSREYPRQAQRSTEPNVTSSSDHSTSAPNSRSGSPSNSNDRQARQNPQSTSNAEPTPIISSPETEHASSFTVPPNIQIEEVSDSDCSQTNTGPEPLVTEQDENSPTTTTEQHSEMVTELLSHTGTVKLSDINDIAGLEALNVKQLKDLLTVNRVNFKGCVERSELLDRASRLWQQHAKSREDLEKLGLEDLCKICMDAPIECVMLECGHMATCTNCGKQLSECPICRQYVVRVVRAFRV